MRDGVWPTFLGGSKSRRRPTSEEESDGEHKEPAARLSFATISLNPFLFRRRLPPFWSQSKHRGRPGGARGSTALANGHLGAAQLAHRDSSIQVVEFDISRAKDGACA